MSLSMSLKEELLGELPWLFDELGFSVFADKYYPEHFGDAWVSLKSDAFPAVEVQFVRDRGEVYILISSWRDSKSCWSLEALCSELSGREIQAPDELHSMAGLLRAQLPFLAEHLNAVHLEETKRRMRLREKRVQQEVMAEYGNRGLRFKA
jgi:hypothetical protein